MSGKPEFFTEQVNDDGSVRFYWAASPKLRRALKGSAIKTKQRLRDAVSGKPLTDRDAAYERCRAITAEVKQLLADAGRLVAADPPAPAIAPTSASPLTPAKLAVLRGTEGLLAWAIAEWKKLPRFAKLEPATKRQYDWIFGLIEAWGGWKRLAAVSEERVREAAETLEAKPRTQQLFLMLLNAIVVRAINKRMPGVTANPVAEVMADMQWEDTASGWVYPRAAVAAFARVFDALGRPSIGTGMVLNEWMAQRPIDLVNQPRDCVVDDGRGGRTVHVWQRKTRTYVPLPIGDVAHLRERLEWQFAWDRENAKRLKVPTLRPATLLLCEDTGEPWTLDHFRKEFARGRAALAGAGSAADAAALERAGIAPVAEWDLGDVTPLRLREAKAKNPALRFVVPTAALWFAHLRHTGITRLHQAGCDDGQIRAVSGHTEPSTVYRYYLATTEAAARTAFAKRDAFEKKEDKGAG